MSDQEYRQVPPPNYFQQTSSLAVISLLSGIASFFIVPLLGAVAAIIIGNLAKKEINQSSGQLTGKGMARWGMILGWVNIGFSLVGLCLALFAITGIVSLPFCLIPFSNVHYMH